MYIKNLKPTATEYQHREISGSREEAGFGIRVYPNGSKYWIYVYRINGKRRIMSLGQYPEMSLADARSEFQKARVQVQKEHEDPIELRNSKNEITKDS